MILQALYDYYQRKSRDPESGIAPIGLEIKELKFIIEIDKSGEFKNLSNEQEKNRKGKLEGKKFLLPRSVGRSGKNAWQTSYLLWDHYGYVVAHPKDDTDESKNMAKKQNEKFVETIKSLPAEVKEDSGVKAVLAFYEKNEVEKVKNHSLWAECSKIQGCNLSFRLFGDVNLIPERDAVQKYLFTSSSETFSDDKMGHCLITGEYGVIKRVHTPTPISKNRNGKIVAMQKNSGYDSYGKEQAFNAPIISSSEFAFSTALNSLIASEDNRVFLSDSTILFWAQQKNDTEITSNEWDLAVKSMFADPPKDNPDEGVLKAKGLFQSISSGELHTEDDERFFALGLAPNVARISIRLWKTGTLREMSGRFCDYFNDLEIVRSPLEPETLTLSRILRATAFEYKMDNVLPNLAGAVVSSVIDGTPFPATLMQQVMRRIRAEQNVNRTRAATLKAYFNRLHRTNRKDLKEVTMSLDRENKDVAYRIGRLFAVLEKIQEEANPGINATIRDKFYGSMSSTPAVVFPILMRLKNHHLGKIENVGRKINFEREISQILDDISIENMPRNLSLEKQGYFAIGYYHQRQYFFTKKPNDTGNVDKGGN